MLFQILLIVLGLTLLVKGADWLVNGSTALAKRYHVSDLAIGLTIVAFGTSAPELVVNTFASIQNHQDLVFGNVIGSNNFNLFVILGISGLISPLIVQSSTVWKEIPISFFAIIVLYFSANAFLFDGDGVLTRIEGFAFLTMFCAFLFYVYSQIKTEQEGPETTQNHLSSFRIFGLIALGLLALMGGGKLVVVNAVELSTSLGMSEKIIGLTVVAAGTSLPELATSVVAVLKKNNDIAVGNIVGSNIFNLFFILGTSSLINPIHFDTAFNEDIYLLAGGTAFLFVAMFTGQKKKLDRWEACMLFLAYLVYMTYLIGKEM